MTVQHYKIKTLTILYVLNYVDRWTPLIDRLDYVFCESSVRCHQFYKNQYQFRCFRWPIIFSILKLLNEGKIKTYWYSKHLQIHNEQQIVYDWYTPNTCKITICKDSVNWGNVKKMEWQLTKDWLHYFVLQMCL